MNIQKDEMSVCKLELIDPLFHIQRDIKTIDANRIIRFPHYAIDNKGCFRCWYVPRGKLRDKFVVIEVPWSKEAVIEG
ncbi:MAG: hypothetical protein AAB116_18035, partial [Candidatus Poribacteria bacterium]